MAQSNAIISFSGSWPYHCLDFGASFRSKIHTCRQSEWQPSELAASIFCIKAVLTRSHVQHTRTQSILLSLQTENSTAASVDHRHVPRNSGTKGKGILPGVAQRPCQVRPQLHCPVFHPLTVKQDNQRLRCSHTVAHDNFLHCTDSLHCTIHNCGSVFGTCNMKTA